MRSFAALALVFAVTELTLKRRKKASVASPVDLDRTA